MICGSLLGQTSFLNANGALITFLIYTAVVVLLAALSNRILKGKSFLSEYFLGSRSLGVWAFALTFAATSSSGGSFMGFPALVYTHGWILALWIGSYMVVPIFVMGLLSKRINQVARRTGAITIPDLLRDRFESLALGGLATFLLVFFVTFNLIAQFKAGAVILQALLDTSPIYHHASIWLSQYSRNVPYFSTASPAYLLCLVAFAASVILYTTYGGFRAVVWTDVLQGFVMLGGIVIMLPLAMFQAGGLGTATGKMAQMTPPLPVELRVTRSGEVSSAAMLPQGTWLEISASGDTARRLFRTAQAAEFPAGAAMAQRLRGAAAEKEEAIPAIEITTPAEVENVPATPLASPVTVSVLSKKDDAYQFGGNQPGVYVTGPGLSKSNPDGFLPLTLALSFFCMWTFSGAGQPGNMVRQMAFKDSRTLRYGMLTVCFYYTLIYFPIVLIFCCARVLLPGWEIEPDRIMPEMAKSVTANAGVPFLAGLLMAAPFAAVMSTVDSFLLISSSAVVRDIYQRNINPYASQKAIKRLTYLVTLAIGSAAMLAAVNPPQYLQDIIVFTGSGLSTSFLVPVGLAMYWPRFNRFGAIAAMLGGFLTYVPLYAIGYLQTERFEPIEVLGFHPFIVGMTGSLVAGMVVTFLTPPPPQKLVEKFFYRQP